MNITVCGQTETDKKYKTRDGGETTIKELYQQGYKYSNATLMQHNIDRNFVVLEDGKAIELVEI